MTLKLWTARIWYKAKDGQLWYNMKDGSVLSHQPP